jgi:hypothetical protein
MSAFHPTKEEIRLVDEQAIILENTIKTHTKAVFDQYGPQVAMDMLLNAGITTIAGGLSYIEGDAERLGATIHVFTAVIHALKLQVAESAAESIIKKAMKK